MTKTHRAGAGRESGGEDSRADATKLPAVANDAEALVGPP
jgi:hypothetical protein